MHTLPLRVLLVQLPVPNNPALNTPLAAGYLKAYAESCGLGDRVVIDILPRAVADCAGDAALVQAIVDRAPDLLGFSLYTWNSERSLEVARRVRMRLPDLRVVVGGPEVQADNTWVREHPAVSVAVIGEGEQAFADLLVQIADGRWRIVPNGQSNLQSTIKTSPPRSLRGTFALPNRMPGIAARQRADGRNLALVSLCVQFLPLRAEYGAAPGQSFFWA